MGRPVAPKATGARPQASVRRLAWCPERTFDNVPWHVTGLEPGEHTVRVVVTGDADGRVTGAEVQIQAAVVYGPEP